MKPLDSDFNQATLRGTMLDNTNNNQNDQVGDSAANAGNALGGQTTGDVTDLRNTKDTNLRASDRLNAIPEKERDLSETPGTPQNPQTPTEHTRTVNDIGLPKEPDKPTGTVGKINIFSQDREGSTEPDESSPEVLENEIREETSALKKAGIDLSRTPKMFTPQSERRAKKVPEGRIIAGSVENEIAGSDHSTETAAQSTQTETETISTTDTSPVSAPQEQVQTPSVDGSGAGSEPSQVSKNEASVASPSAETEPATPQATPEQETTTPPQQSNTDTEAPGAESGNNTENPPTTRSTPAQPKAATVPKTNESKSSATENIIPEYAPLFRKDANPKGIEETTTQEAPQEEKPEALDPVELGTDTQENTRSAEKSGETEMPEVKTNPATGSTVQKEGSIENAPLQPSQSPAGIPAVPTPPKNAPRGASRTYQDDFKEETKEEKPDIVSQLVAQEAKKKESAERRNIKSPKNILFISLAAFLLVLAVGVMVYILFIHHSKEEPLMNPYQTFIPTSNQATFIIDDSTTPDELYATLHANMAKKRVSNTADQIYIEKSEVVQTKKGTTTKIRYATPDEFFGTLGSGIPHLLVKSLTPYYMVGIYHHNGTSHPFLILTNDNYEQAYQGMLDWEAELPGELALWFSPRGAIGQTSQGGTTDKSLSLMSPNTAREIKKVLAFSESATTTPTATTTLTATSSTSTATTTNTVGTSSVQDTDIRKNFDGVVGFHTTTIDNRSVRISKTLDGTVNLVYTFQDPYSIIITDDVETLQAVLKRLSTAREK